MGSQAGRQAGRACTVGRIAGQYVSLVAGLGGGWWVLRVLTNSQAIQLQPSAAAIIIMKKWRAREKCGAVNA